MIKKYNVETTENICVECEYSIDVPDWVKLEEIEEYIHQQIIDGGYEPISQEMLDWELVKIDHFGEEKNG